MKKVILLAIACVAFSFAQAQTQDTTVRFNETVHNFGDIPQGVPASWSFEFTNTGTAPVTVLSVQASCGCTASDWTKEPIAPGAKGFVKATYNAAALNAFNKHLTVKTDSTPDTILLYIKGTVNAPVAPAPESK
jgi:hypothetical protein